MKVAKALGAFVGSAGTFVTTASNLAILAGLLYLADCRLTARSREAVDSCYFSALTLSGVGVAGRSGFAAGYGTYNPALKRPEEEPPEPPEPPKPAPRRSRRPTT